LTNASIPFLINVPQFPSKMFDLEASCVVAKMRGMNTIVVWEHAICDKDHMRTSEHYCVAFAFPVCKVNVANLASTKDIWVGPTAA